MPIGAFLKPCVFRKAHSARGVVVAPRPRLEVAESASRITSGIGRRSTMIWANSSKATKPASSGFSRSSRRMLAWLPKLLVAAHDMQAVGAARVIAMWHSPFPCRRYGRRSSTDPARAVGGCDGERVPGAQESAMPVLTSRIRARASPAIAQAAASAIFDDRPGKTYLPTDRRSCRPGPGHCFATASFSISQSGASASGDIGRMMVDVPGIGPATRHAGSAARRR